MLKFDDLELHQLFSVPVGVIRMPKLDDKIRKSLIESKEVVQRPNPNKPNDKLEVLND